MNITNSTSKIRRKDTPVLPKTRVAIQLDRMYITTLKMKLFYFSTHRVKIELLLTLLINNLFKR